MSLDKKIPEHRDVKEVSLSQIDKKLDYLKDNNNYVQIEKIAIIFSWLNQNDTQNVSQNIFNKNLIPWMEKKGFDFNAALNKTTWNKNVINT